MAHASAVRVAPRRTPARRVSGPPAGAAGSPSVACSRSCWARRWPSGSSWPAGHRGLWLALNWAYQVIRKPTELFFPVSGALIQDAAPDLAAATDRCSAEHSTVTITPDLLAALAQVEGAGNPVARTYWRWRLAWNPFELYRPASSAVGMYQITDPTFQQARRYCIHDHVVIEDGPWTDPRSCWFNRVLHAGPAESRGRDDLRPAGSDGGMDSSPRQGHHARPRCGSARTWPPSSICVARAPGRPTRAAACGSTPGQRCGDHDVARYLADVNALKRQFVRLAATA